MPENQAMPGTKQASNAAEDMTVAIVRVFAATHQAG
jgi:hypothetical protein